ncbi:MAG: uridylate kinase [Planctomycetaceae bacterium]|nr:hypothetical protein [Planctomycetales bacterium]MCB9925509.1 uridylate kinase [Planctomycetaceae bacterium]
MSGKFLRVSKVGGSLFDFADLPTALRCWLDDQPGANVLIAGGGPFAEAVREADRVYSLGDSNSHLLAIEAMSVSAKLLLALLPESRLVHSLEEIPCTVAAHKIAVLDPVSLLTSPECRLPRSWDVTSDSIAAFAATELGAHELVLFKSAHLPPNMRRAEAAEKGFVDGHFVRSALEIQTVRWVNLRVAPVTERPL